MSIYDSFLLLKGDSSLVRFADAKRTSLGMTRSFFEGSVGRMGADSVRPHSPHALKPLTERHFDGVLADKSAERLRNLFIILKKMKYPTAKLQLLMKVRVATDPP